METPVQKKPKLLGELLLQARLISQAQLNLALREQKRLGVHLGEALSILGFVSQDALASVLAEFTNTEAVDVLHTVIDPEVLRTVPYDLAKRLHLIPLSRDGQTLTIAMADTFNVVAVDTLVQATGLSVEIVAAPLPDILEVLEREYSQGASIDETIDQCIKQGIVGRGDEAGGEGPMIRLVDQIIALAVRNRATDIHVESEEKFMRVRMRVDGILRQEVLMPKPLQSAMLARLKIMGNLNVTEKRVPQDGRISFLFGRRPIDLRISTLPTAHGENIVLRVLDKSAVVLELGALGFSAQDRTALESVLDRPNGLILVTGPTGSGKTTTLYTALGQINALEKGVFTLEDPIEYRLPLISQTQIADEVGLTFAAGLRALLRQDPDVVLVGEIRDIETAELATRAALTGHLVLTTLHTNDAGGAIPRLIDMGVPSFLLSYILIAIVGQRLVRRICKECKEPVEQPEPVLEKLGIQWGGDGPVKLWRGIGCRACSGTGYRGRLGLYEVMILDKRLQGAIVHGADVAEILQMAKQQGMRFMHEDGIDKAMRGDTTIEEVLRVAP